MGPAIQNFMTKAVRLQERLCLIQREAGHIGHGHPFIVVGVVAHDPEIHEDGYDDAQQQNSSKNLKAFSCVKFGFQNNDSIQNWSVSPHCTQGATLELAC